MPEMANLAYNMYMHMIQNSQKYRQVLTDLWGRGCLFGIGYLIFPGIT